jgi:hypothetical protein
VPNRLNALLGSTPELKKLAQTAHQIEGLQRQYQAIAPASLLQGSHVMRYDNGRLILAADNGAVASKLRQLAPQLISSFRTRGCEVTGIQIQVQVNAAPPRTPPTPRKLGPQGQMALDDLAHSLPEGKLRAAVERLSRLR